MKKINSIALFRLSVLGQLASREHLEKGELKTLLRELASKTYDIPGSKRVHLSEATIERWYYAFKEGGVDALAPKPRKDSGHSQLPVDVQRSILIAKKEEASRSINAVIRVLELNGIVAKGQLSRSSVHRLLKAHQLSSRAPSNIEIIERRRFVAQYAGDIWQGDVMHGPSICMKGKRRKVYLVSFMDDASRLITHSEFRLGETALDIQAVLKQAILKRGLPKRIILDNGSAYRCGSLQGICARLGIQLVYCRPYQPQGKGKLERWHSRCKKEFIQELDLQQIQGLADLNARLWAYLEHSYHVTKHHGLDDNLTPIERWRKDVAQIRALGVFASNIDVLFYHRLKRHVRKDGCISLNGQFYEVPYELCGQKIIVVIDPELNQAKWVESSEGKKLGDAIVCDPLHNLHRKRQRPKQKNTTGNRKKTLDNPVELTYAEYQGSLIIKPTEEEK